MDAAPRVLANRYRLGAVIGRGGMGTVHRAIDQELERAVAVKVLSQTEDPDASARFIVEAKRTAAVRHPCIVEVFDVGREGDDAFIVMELLEGETLAQRLERGGPLPAAEAVAVAALICDALGAAHDGGLVHRDLKPANVFLSPAPDGPPRVKLLDFGIAKRIDGATARTDPSMIVGTLEYLSPEQIRGGPLDGRADLYALGLTLYRALTGKRPFEADNVASLIHQHLMTAPASLREHAAWREIPPALDAAVLRLLAKEAKARPASARDAKRELMAALEPASAPNDTTRRITDIPEVAARGTGERVLDLDEAAVASRELELDLRPGAGPGRGASLPPVPGISRFEGAPAAASTPAFAPARAPLPSWLSPLARVPETASKRVAGYSLFVLFLYIVFFSGHLWPSLGLLLLASAGGLSFWARRRASR